MEGVEVVLAVFKKVYCVVTIGWGGCLKARCEVMEEGTEVGGVLGEGGQPRLPMEPG